MPQLRLVPAATQPVALTQPVADPAGRPQVSLRLLMAASGRCSCDDCLIAYRRGDKTAGIVRTRGEVGRLTAVR